MAKKWNLQDIRPAQPKQENIPVPKRTVRQDIKPRITHVENKDYLSDPDLATIDVIDGNQTKRKRVFVTVLVAFLIIGVGFVVNLMLGGAEVVVNPKSKDFSVQAQFTSYKTPQSDELGFELLVLEATGERQVKANGKETVSERAEGKIFVYNTKNTASQRLIKNTRFEDENGLIFRIKESIEVPGVKTDSDGKLVPGVIAADVFADGTGEQYNIPPSKFTVPGLKGTDQFETVYGETSAAFTGGFEGDKYIIDEAELQTAQQSLQIELRDKLLSRLEEERPAGFVLYEGAITFVYDTLPSTEYGESLATIKQRARLQVPIFKADEFAVFLAKRSIPDYKGEPIKIPDPSSLVFSYTSSSTLQNDLAESSSIVFTLKGNTKAVWEFDEEILRNELLGIKEIDAPTIFSKYSSISHVQATLRPFWTNTFPESLEKIRIVTEIK